MSYTLVMTIEHHIVTDKDGKPIAAQIPWDEFEALQERLADGESGETISPEWTEEIKNRAREIDQGEVELTDGDDFLERLEAV